MSRLDLADLRVESFSTNLVGDHVSILSASDSACGGTNSLNYATQCNCSAGANCTVECVEYSQATDWQACCG